MLMFKLTQLQGRNYHRAVQGTAPGPRELRGPVDHHMYTEEKKIGCGLVQGRGPQQFFAPRPQVALLRHCTITNLTCSYFVTPMRNFLSREQFINFFLFSQDHFGKIFKFKIRNIIIYI